MSYIVSCYDRKCPARVEARNSEEGERKMAAAGWQLGLEQVSAQAYYTCPDCAPGLVACRPIVPRRALTAGKRQP